MLRRIWLTPPLGIARLGSAAGPCQAYSWAPNDITPGWSEKTRLQAEETLEMADDGTVTTKPPNAFNRIEFKDDAERFYPVCPFFELHGEWDDDGAVRSGPLTPEILAAHAPPLGDKPVQLSDVVWEVVVANPKAHHYTLQDSDRLEARVALRGDQTRRTTLEGRTPTQVRGRPVTGEPLIPPGLSIPMGAVQLARPTEAAPELRLRFYAPAGLVYGAADLDRRPLSGIWTGFRLPGREIVNPDSNWARLQFDRHMIAPLRTPDGRNNPGGLAAADEAGVSLGLVDDASDGLVTCTVPGLPPARARVVVGSPDFAPNARTIVSLQDGLSDRVYRASTRGEEIPLGELEEIVHDIFERRSRRRTS